MRTPLMILLFAVAMPVAAQQRTPPQLEPIPEPPPMPEGDGQEDVMAPDVTIVKQGEDTVEEYRIRGRLYMVKVTPLHGTPYYLVDRHGDGVMVRQEGESNLAVPMWVIRSW